MTNLFLKLRLIGWPFFYLLLAATALYAGLVWLLQAALGEPPLVILDAWYWRLVLGANIVAVLLKLRPRLHLLNNGKRGNRHILLYLVTGATLGLAAYNAANVLVVGALRLVPLASLAEVSRYQPFTAYTARNFYVDYNRTTVEESYTSIKGGLRLTLYYTAPLLSSATDTVQGNVQVWLGSEMEMAVNLRDSAIWKKFAQFKGRASKNFRTRPYTYLVRTSYSEELLTAACHYPAAKRRAVPLILLAQYTPFEQRTESALRWLRMTLLCGTVTFMLLVLCFPVSQTYVLNYDKTGRIPDVGWPPGVGSNVD